MDLRIKKTYRALVEAFTKLLAERRYEDITVAMLCDEAMIRRTTFYKHFSDKADFFTFFVEDLRMGLVRLGEELVEGGAGAPPRAIDATTAIFRQFVVFLREHEAMMDHIFQSSMAGAMMQVVCGQMAGSLEDRYREVWAGTPGNEASLEDASAFAAGGVVRLLGMWWASGHDAATEGRFVRSASALVARVMACG